MKTTTTGILNLPTVANSREGQIVRIHSTEEVTSVTVAVSGGGTISGTSAVTQLIADESYASRGQHLGVSISGSGAWIRPPRLVKPATLTLFWMLGWFILILYIL